MPEAPDARTPESRTVESGAVESGAVGARPAGTEAPGAPGAASASGSAAGVVDREGLRETLRTALRVERFVDEVTAGAPYRSLDGLVEAARRASARLTPAEIDEALAAHPRIGERAAGGGAEAAHSRREQGSAPDAGDPVLAAAIADGNRDYEARFGRIFLIRAAGRSRAEILAELRRRLELDDAAELAVVGEQLAEIALLRLAAGLADAAAPIGR